LLIKPTGPSALVTKKKKKTRPKRLKLNCGEGRGKKGDFEKQPKKTVK